ncbi:hypothetical protein CANCADRAFT_3447 [Tortispora caseinolytica NRRL Y-17796]|uniref:Uncharacterized protein n=1 Tax=Tortispora caseinolytica NRRL Y-17796 TaxID=767744 RepID=A0A1E4TAJ5_9ASCO|nr:hypothetical protein CANCADRAFT_3447 [Tortispora caseinolytica NRRL Y-17796]
MATPDVSELITQASTATAKISALSSSSDLSVHYDLSKPIRLHNNETDVVTISKFLLLSLPESIMILLFPSGSIMDINGDEVYDWNNVTDVVVSFDARCLDYIIDCYSEQIGMLDPSKQNKFIYTADLSTPVATSVQNAVRDQHPTLICLREDLDYYVIAPKSLPTESLKPLRLSVGKMLVENRSVFLGLYSKLNASKSSTESAEQYLMTMLCTSGFDKNEPWPYRALDSGRTLISSLALKHLQIVDGSDVTASRLLLFWQRPARKCWWDHQTMTIPQIEDDTANISGLDVKVHIRRVWTLEISIIGLR